VEQDDVDRAAGAVRGRDAGRGDKPRILPPGLVWAEAGAAGPQPVKAFIPQPLLDPDWAPAFFDLDLVATGEGRLGAGEPFRDFGPDLERVVR
jgi:hypothetical protein